jgi:hypothetical protein
MARHDMARHVRSRLVGVIHLRVMHVMKVHVKSMLVMVRHVRKGCVRIMHAMVWNVRECMFGQKYQGKTS